MGALNFQRQFGDAPSFGIQTPSIVIPFMAPQKHLQVLIGANDHVLVFERAMALIVDEVQSASLLDVLSFAALHNLKASCVACVTESVELDTTWASKVICCHPKLEDCNIKV